MASHRHGRNRPVVPSASSPPMASPSTTWRGSRLSQTEPLNVGSVPTECRQPMRPLLPCDSLPISASFMKLGRASALSGANSAPLKATRGHRATSGPFNPSMSLSVLSGWKSNGFGLSSPKGGSREALSGEGQEVVPVSVHAAAVSVVDSLCLPADGGMLADGSADPWTVCGAHAPGAGAESLVGILTDPAALTLILAAVDRLPLGEATQGRGGRGVIADSVLSVVSPCSTGRRRAGGRSKCVAGSRGKGAEGMPPATPADLLASIQTIPVKAGVCVNVLGRGARDGRAAPAPHPLPKLEDATLNPRKQKTSGNSQFLCQAKAVSLNKTPTTVAAVAGKSAQQESVYYVE